MVVEAVVVLLFGAQEQSNRPFDSTVLRGRLSDEEGHVLGARRVEFRVVTHGSNGSSSHGSNVTTGSDGEFRLEVNNGIASKGRCKLSIRLLAEVKHGSLSYAGTDLDLSGKTEAEACDLGDIVLHEPGSRQFLSKIDDQRLEGIYSNALGGIAFSSDARHDLDTCLTEMIGRGGPRWQHFIETEYRKATEAHGQAGAAHVLTALRRVQRRDDPCALDGPSASVIEAVFPEVPELPYRLRNVDKSGESFGVSSREIGTGDRNTYCRVEVRTENGAPVEGEKNGSVRDFGSISYETMGPGDSRDCEFKLSKWFEFPRAGTYSLQISHCLGNSRFAETRGSLAGWVCSKSPAFELRLLPRTVMLAQHDRAELKDCFWSIDFSQPPLVVSLPRRDDERYTGNATSPQDRIYRSGWSAIPVLLGALEESSSPGVRAWVLALLTDVTGLNGPERDPTFGAAVGRYYSRLHWPGVASGKELDLGQAFLVGTSNADAATQQELVRRWLDTKSSFVVKE